MVMFLSIDGWRWTKAVNLKERMSIKELSQHTLHDKSQEKEKARKGRAYS